MESGSALDLFALLGEGDTLGGDFLVELCDGCDVLVDDRLVDKRPKSFGGLQLRGVRLKPASASRAKVASSASKKSFDTPLETYQKVSPVAGETNAVT